MSISGLGLIVAAWTALVAASASDFTPHDGDAYSGLVARAEAGDATVDFKAMRFAWLDSAARKREPDLHDATKAMYQAVQAQDAATVRADAEKIIAAHYTDIIAHKFRRQACTVLKDQACSDHEHFVEFGLLDSIMKSGDGTTPETAMLVADVSEEYVVIGLGGQRPGGQALVNRNGKVYDQMTVTDQNGKQLTLWFDISIAITKELPGLS